MTDEALSATWARWRSWWLGAPAPGTTNSSTARGIAILARVRRGPAAACTAAVWPVLLVAALATGQLVHQSASTHAPLPVAIVFSVLLAVPLLWRRDYPAATFAVLAAVAFVQWAADVRLWADVALWIALYVMFEYSAARINWLAVVLLALGSVLAVLRWEHSVYRPQTLLLLIAISVAVLSAGVAVRNRRSALAAAIERGEQLERDRHQQALLELAAERARVAREMHDIVAHGLLVMVRLSDAAVAKGSIDPGSSRAAMVQVSATGREALSDMRRLLGVLRKETDLAGGSESSTLRPQPGLADLGALIDQVRATGLVVHWTVSGAASRLGTAVELVVYRTVQEALTNVLKHARRPTHARVALIYGPEQIEIEVEDDGDPAAEGPGQSAGARHGLIGMTERVAAYGGQVRAGRRPARGWLLRAVIPTTTPPTPSGPAARETVAGRTP